MENQKTTAPKILGIVISVLAGFSILGNSVGAMMFSFMKSRGLYNEIAEVEHPLSGLMNIVFSHYGNLCLSMVVLDTFFLVGGLFLIKYKMWANRMLTVVSVIQIVYVWGIYYYIIDYVPDFEFRIFMIAAWAIGLAMFSAIFVALIWYLNRKYVLEHFE